MRAIQLFVLAFVCAVFSVGNATVGERNCTSIEAGFEARAYLKLKYNTYNVLISSYHGSDYVHGLPTKMEYIFSAIPKNPDIAKYGVRIGTILVAVKEDGSCANLPEIKEESGDVVPTVESYQFGDYLQEIKEGPK